MRTVHSLQAAGKAALALAWQSALVASLFCANALAKGLDELAEGSPENDDSASSESSNNDASTPSADAEEPSVGADDKSKPAATATIQSKAVVKTPGPVSKALADKLYLAISAARVVASKSSGDWQGSGMSDVAVGYKLPLHISEKIGVYGTYRYAPVAVSGEEGRRSYRGVWQAHYLGGRLAYSLSSRLTLSGSLEAGYVMVYLNNLDGLGTVKEHEKNGGQIAIGTGLDWTLLEKFSAGPRLVGGFGSMTTIQIGGGANFLF